MCFWLQNSEYSVRYLFGRCGCSSGAVLLSHLAMYRRPCCGLLFKPSRQFCDGLSSMFAELASLVLLWFNALVLFVCKCVSLEISATFEFDLQGT